MILSIIRKRLCVVVLCCYVKRNAVPCSLWKTKISFFMTSESVERVSDFVRLMFISSPRHSAVQDSTTFSFASSRSSLKATEKLRINVDDQFHCLPVVLLLNQFNDFVCFFFSSFSLDVTSRKVEEDFACVQATGKDASVVGPLTSSSFVS